MKNSLCGCILELVIGKILPTSLIFSLLLFWATSCSVGTKTVKIGYVNPITGALSGNGEGYDWVIDQMYEYTRRYPILMHGRPADLEIIVYDSESNPEICREMAERLVLYDKVDMLVATQTPENVIPIVKVAEEYGVPCVAMQAPVDPVAAALDHFEWTFHAFWTIDTIYECYRSLWTQAGYPKGCGAAVGFLFANDADGNCWHEVFARRAQEDGYRVIDPGQYPVNADSFDEIARLFKQEKVDIITGTNAPPDFHHAMKAFAKYLVPISCITMGKCCLIYADAASLGEAAVGIMTEVWWDESANNISDLTGYKASEISERYARDNFGLRMPQPAAYAYASLEIAIHTLRQAQTTNKKKLRSTLAKLDVQTLVGPIIYNHRMGGLVYSETPVGGGQWQLEDGDIVLRIIDHSLYPGVKLTGTFSPANVSDNIQTLATQRNTRYEINKN